jgi:hypothetical protein
LELLISLLNLREFFTGSYPGPEQLSPSSSSFNILWSPLRSHSFCLSIKYSDAIHLPPLCYRSYSSHKFHLIILIILGYEYNVWSSTLCSSFLKPSLHSYLVQMSSPVPSSQTHPISISHYMLETLFHIHANPQSKLKFLDGRFFYLLLKCQFTIYLTV